MIDDNVQNARMISMRVLALFLIWLCLPSTIIGQTILPDFFQDLYDKFAPEYDRIKSEEYSMFCREFDLDEQFSANRSAYLQIYFYHDLFTGNGATDCSRGGILRIPYFWHWIDPNPRHSIRLMPDSLLLTSVDRPKHLSKYKTYADVDRIPSVYLGDLVGKQPKYFHANCGSFFTFGWCSEREMAFCALLSVLGYKCKVKQTGIHTWSEVWLSFLKENGTPSNIVAAVDNTFNSIRWEAPRAGVSLSRWATDFGNGTQVRWYNSVVSSDAERARLKSIVVSEVAAARIESIVRSALENLQAMDEVD